MGVVLFTDSEAVRGSFLKGTSQNHFCNKMLHAFLVKAERTKSQMWIERVASQSNPADALSREIVEVLNGIQRTRIDLETIREVIGPMVGE